MSTKLIRLKPFPFSSLPSHPSLDGGGGGGGEDVARPPLERFLHSALEEAQTLVSTTIPQTFKVDKKLRSSPPSAAKVQLSTRSIDQDYWVCRKSVHTDAPETGTATWTEFENGLRENHSENEMDYTPSVASVEHLLEWPTQAAIDGGWRDVHMHVNMITHTFKPGALVSPRSFISLVISAAEQDDHPSSESPPSQAFYTVQIPLTHDPSVQASKAPLSDAVRSQIQSVAPKNTVFASYASVERVLSRSGEDTAAAAAAAAGPSHHDDEVNQRKVIEWTMATTSDAGGLVPQWVQRSWTMGGVPKAVVADVGLFLGWTAKKRAKK